MSNEFWAEFESLLDKSKPEPIEYRVHYNTAGEIYLCTMQQHPADTAYLVVTKNEYDEYFHYCVEEGQLKRILQDSGYRVQLQKSTTGFKVVKDHAGLLVEDEDWDNVEYYEYRDY